MSAYNWQSVGNRAGWDYQYAATGNPTKWVGRRISDKGKTTFYANVGSTENGARKEMLDKAGLPGGWKGRVV
jgi:hypothetical protein